MTNRGDQSRADEPVEGMEYPPEEDVENAEGVTLDRWESLDRDFSDEDRESVGESTESGEPYTPPTDPVIVPEAQDEGGASSPGAPLPDEIEGGEEATGEVTTLTDDDLVYEATHALRADARTADLDLHVLVRDRVVTLRGTVRSLEDSEAAEEVVREVPMVRDVVDETVVEGEG